MSCVFLQKVGVFLQENGCFTSKKGVPLKNVGALGAYLVPITFIVTDFSLNQDLTLSDVYLYMVFQLNVPYDA